MFNPKLICNTLRGELSKSPPRRGFRGGSTAASNQHQTNSDLTKLVNFETKDNHPL
jgi:hypothetical protein